MDLLSLTVSSITVLEIAKVVGKSHLMVRALRIVPEGFLALNSKVSDFGISPSNRPWRRRKAWSKND